MNVTVPAGVPDPGGAAETVAVKITGWPNTEGLTDELTVVEVFAGFMSNGLLMAGVKVPLGALRVFVPLVLMFKLLNVARPLASVNRVAVPPKLPPPLLIVIVTDTPGVATGRAPAEVTANEATTVHTKMTLAPTRT